MRSPEYTHIMQLLDDLEGMGKETLSIDELRHYATGIESHMIAERARLSDSENIEDFFGENP